VIARWNLLTLRTITRIRPLSHGYPAYYPLQPVRMQKPIRAVLMDLDGTTVRSEEFWIWIIQMSVASLSGNPDFTLEEEDLPFVSGTAFLSTSPIA